MFVKGHPPYYGPGRPKGSLNQRTLEAKAFARQLVSDPTYQQKLQARLLAGEAGAMEPILWAYAYGKPKESVEIQYNFEALNTEEMIQLEGLIKRIE